MWLQSIAARTGAGAGPPHSSEWTNVKDAGECT